MQNFIVHANIEHFHASLATVRDPGQRSVILGLLAKEIDKLPQAEQEPERRRFGGAETGGPSPRAPLR